MQVPWVQLNKTSGRTPVSHQSCYTDRRWMVNVKWWTVNGGLFGSPIDDGLSCSLLSPQWGGKLFYWHVEGDLLQILTKLKVERIVSSKAGVNVGVAVSLVPQISTFINLDRIHPLHLSQSSLTSKFVGQLFSARFSMCYDWYLSEKKHVKCNQYEVKCHLPVKIKYRLWL